MLFLFGSTVKRLALLTLMTLLFLAISLISSAQELTREDIRPFVRFSIAGGRDDNRFYYTPDIPDYPRMSAILDTIIPVYNSITGQPWTLQIIVVWMDVDVANNAVIGNYLNSSDAYVTRRESPNGLDPKICHLRVFTSWESAPNLESRIARQIFHCLQRSMQIVPESEFTNRDNAWWYLGVAEWAASRAYPSQYPQLIHSTFDHRHDVTTNRLDNFYFWEFMASGRGVGDERAVMYQMSLLANPDTFPINRIHEPIELFHNWALTLLNRQLPIPPIIDLTTSDISAGESGLEVVSLTRFSVDYKNLVGFDVKPGNIGFVTVSGITQGDYAVSVQSATGYDRLSDGVSYQLCPSNAGTMLVFSRARGDAGDRISVTLEWGQEASSSPCTSKPEEAATTVNCMVGTWLVAEFPLMQAGLELEMDTSAFVFNFLADGTMNGSYTVHSEAGSMVIEVDVPFSGTYQVQNSSDNESDYHAEFVWSFDEGGKMTTSNGSTVTDMTALFYRDTANSMPWSPLDGRLSCNNEEMTWLTSDGTGSFVLERQP